MPGVAYILDGTPKTGKSPFSAASDGDYATMRYLGLRA
jgi:hypothetical protein